MLKNANEKKSWKQIFCICFQHNVEKRPKQIAVSSDAGEPINIVLQVASFSF